MLELVLKAVVEGKCGDFCMSLICTVIVHTYDCNCYISLHVVGLVSVPDPAHLDGTTGDGGSD